MYSATMDIETIEGAATSFILPPPPHSAKLLFDYPGISCYSAREL